MLLCKRVRKNVKTKNIALAEEMDVHRSTALGARKSAQEVEKKEVHIFAFGEVVREGCGR